MFKFLVIAVTIVVAALVLVPTFLSPYLPPEAVEPLSKGLTYLVDGLTFAADSALQASDNLADIAPVTPVETK